jgi:hypothetical protein
VNSNFLYDEDILRNPDQHLVLANELSSAAILAPANEQVGKLNVAILAKMTSFEATFTSHDSLIVERPEQRSWLLAWTTTSSGSSSQCSSPLQ